MIKSFVMVIFLLVVVITMVTLHYMSYDTQTPQRKIDDITSLSKLSSLSLSVAYYEPRQANEIESNPAYPQMNSINKMDFIYAK